MLRRQRCSLVLPQLSISFLLKSLVSGLGLLALSNLGGGGLDDTDSNGLPHVTDSEPSKRWELREGLDTQPSDQQWLLRTDGSRNVVFSGCGRRGRTQT